VARALRIVGAIPGDPFDPLTWSGLSRHLFTALERRGVLAGAVDARPPRWLGQVAKAAAVSPNLQRWRERYEFSPVTRAGLGFVGARKAWRVDPRPDAVLQIGAYYDFTGFNRLQPALRCSYHDCNLALYSRGWTFVKDRTASHIRHTLRAEQRVFDRIDLIMTMTDWLRESFIEDFGQDPAKVITVGLGANIDRIPAPYEHGWERPRLLFIGLDWERKGGPTLLDAFARVHAERPDAELSIVGPEEPAGAGQPGVRWLGRIYRTTPEAEAEIARLHSEATAFVMPSIFEPFGNVFLEAMAHGLPCVGTRCCAMPEIIDEGVTGLLATPGDPENLAQALLDLIADPGRASRMGAAGRRRVLERFTWDRVSTSMITEIEHRLSSTP
jgi:glycosyltransferase involved in cell wall biosynthesis